MQTKNQKGPRICKVSQNVVAAAVLLGWMFIVLVIWVILLVVWPDGSGYSPFYWPVWVLLCPASIAGQKRETDFELSRGGSNIRSGRALYTSRPHSFAGYSLEMRFICLCFTGFLIVEHQAEYHILGALLGKVAVLHIEGYAARHVVVGIGLGPEHLLAALGVGAAPVYDVGQGGDDLVVGARRLYQIAQHVAVEVEVVGDVGILEYVHVVGVEPVFGGDEFPVLRLHGVGVVFPVHAFARYTLRTLRTHGALAGEEG